MAWLFGNLCVCPWFSSRYCWRWVDERLFQSQPKYLNIFITNSKLHKNTLPFKNNGEGIWNYKIYLLFSFYIFMRPMHQHLRWYRRVRAGWALFEIYKLYQLIQMWWWTLRYITTFIFIFFWNTRLSEDTKIQII